MWWSRARSLNASARQRHGASRRAWGRWLAAALTVVMVVPAWIVVSTAPVAPPANLGVGPDDARIEAGEALATALAALPPTVRAAAWTPQTEAFLGGTRGTSLGTTEEPAGRMLADIMARTPHGADWNLHPVPDAPLGPDPLLVALHRYAATTGVTLPTDPLLRSQIADLRLQAEAEQGVARVVLAYQQAFALEEKALSNLSWAERQLLGPDPAGNIADEFSVDAGNTDLAAERANLLARIDMSQRVQAAGLLLRTIEATRHAIALPPSAVAEVTPGAGFGAAALFQHAEGDMLPPATAGAPPPSNDAWQAIYAVMQLGAPERASPVQPLPSEELASALAGLAEVLGAPVPPARDLDALSGLPPSLNQALATIVTARRVGLETSSADAHAATLMAAIEDATPILAAWAELIDVKRRVVVPDTAALAVLHDPARTTTPWSLFPVPASPRPMPSLAAELGAIGVTRADASTAAALLPVALKDGIATALAGLRRHEETVHEVLAGMPNNARTIIVEDLAEVARLEQAAVWSPADAATVTTWARAAGELSGEDLARLTASQGALASDLASAARHFSLFARPDAAATSAAVSMPLAAESTELSGEPTDRPAWYRAIWQTISGLNFLETASAQSGNNPLSPGCPALAGGLSRCSRDIWFRAGSRDREIVVTGFGSTQVGPATVGTMPAVMVDLGGDDTYEWPVGGASGIGSVQFTLDLGGSDRYESVPSRLAHGAGQGPGTMGVLWDMAGDDHYVHNCQGESCGGQGYGAAGGQGFLIDVAGSDDFHANESAAHGVGLGQGVGILLDLGDGSDSFSAGTGQAYAAGDGSIGLLLNDGLGTNSYVTQRGSLQYQGGVKPETAATSVFVDLGGPDTWYSNVDLDEDAITHHYGNGTLRRGDDRAWLYRSSTRGVAVAVDSTVDDADGDAFPNLLELIAGSNPSDPASVPGGNDTTASVVDLLVAVLGEVPDLSSPSSLLQGTIWHDEYLCAADADGDGTKCPGLLRIAGTSGDTMARAAQVAIDLGGDDVYESEVAGPGDYWAPGAVLDQEDLANSSTAASRRHVGVGSISIDVGGDDRYGDAQGVPTQAALVVPGQPKDDLGGAATDSSPSDSLARVSLLFDADGDDDYRAASWSQGAIQAPEACNYRYNDGAAWLIDVRGNDQYAANESSQAAVENHGGRGGILDIAGDDTYYFAAQAQAFGGSAGGSLTGPNRAPACLSSRDAMATALLVDFDGRDQYHGTTSFESDPPKVVDLEQRQGYADKRGTHQMAAFLDLGQQSDAYTGVSFGGQRMDLSSFNNNLTRSNVSVETRAVSLFSDSPAWFASLTDSDGDGAPALVEFLTGTDSEDASDHGGSAWHVLSNTSALRQDPQNATRHLRLEDEGAWLRIPGGTAGPAGLPMPGLLIGGRGDSMVDEDAELIIDLGGDNRYTGAFAGGRLTPGITLLFDAGAGNTSYHPEVAACSLDEPLFVVSGQGPVPSSAGAVCPSLGGAAQGVALVVDGGGRNEFRTEGFLNLTGEGTWMGDLVTQGAARPKAVGAVVTWNATNNFSAYLNATGARGAAASGPLHLALRGNSQGASEQGVGLLAALDGGNDTFVSSVHFVPTPTVPAAAEYGLTQGASWSSPHIAPGTTDAAATDARAAGMGMLVNDRGDNRYRAPDGFAQGFAHGGVRFAGMNGVATARSMGVATGILWSGVGNDVFVAGPRSQGSATGAAHVLDWRDGETVLLVGNGLGLAGVDAPAQGILFEPAGHDFYISTAGGPALSQGGAYAGLGALIDLAGDDRYDARAASEVQGSGREGIGVLIDGGGHDQYVAASHAQGFATDAINAGPLPMPAVFPVVDTSGGRIVHDTLDSNLDEHDRCNLYVCHRPTLGMLLDVSGQDIYDLQSHGLGEAVATCFGRNPMPHPRSYNGVLLDGQGERDRYPAAIAGPANNATWTQRGSGCDGAAGAGVDANGLDQGLRLLAEVPAPLGITGVNLTYAQAGAPAGAPASGLVQMVATVRMTPTDPSHIDRVSFLADNRVIGHGDLTGNGDEGHLTYELLWDTTAGDGIQPFEDGAYDLVASVFLKAPHEGGVHVDAPAYESAARSITIDNPPALALDVPEARWISPPLGRGAPMALHVSRDVEWPHWLSQAQQAAACQGRNPCEPGADVRAYVNAWGPPIDERYFAAGSHDLAWNGTEGVVDVWPDGEYSIEFVATDSGGATTRLTSPLLRVDGTAPTSTVTTPVHAGLAHRAGPALAVTWRHDDADGSGVQAACLLEMSPRDTGWEVLQTHCPSPSQRILLVPQVDTDDRLHFATAAVDVAGNAQYLCRDPALHAPACPPQIGHGPGQLSEEAIHPITVDFDPPRIVAAGINGEMAAGATTRPGAAINFTADVTDLGSGVASVTARIGDDQVAFWQDRNDNWVFDAWGVINQDRHASGPREETIPFSIVAQDRAQNMAVFRETVLLDSMPPRLLPQPPRFLEITADGGERWFNTGRPGHTMELVVWAEDAAIDDVAMDASSLVSGAANPRPCEPTENGPWLCTAIIPSTADDGDHALALIASDKAGNSNSDHSVVARIRGQPLAIYNTSISSIQHGGFTVNWTTDFEAEGWVSYGRSDDLVHRVAAHTPRGKEHQAIVTGLLPASIYHYSVSAQGDSGVTTTTEIATLETANGFDLRHDGPSANATQSGRVDAAFVLEPMAPGGSVAVELAIQDAGRIGSSQPLSTTLAEAGRYVASFDSNAYPDGDYVLIWTAARGADVAVVESSPFRIDNTEPTIVPVSPLPGALVAGQNLTLTVLLDDPGRGSGPIMESVRLSVGGHEIPLRQDGAAAVPAAAGMGTVSFIPTSPLPAGDIEIDVEVTDDAGNVGRLAWPLMVDRSPPVASGTAVVSTSRDGPAARSGEVVRVSLQVSDAAGVAGVELDLSAWGHAAQPLLGGLGDQWSLTFQIPNDVPEGLWSLPVRGQDIVGNTGVIAQAVMEVDATPPSILAVRVADVTTTTALLEVTVDEASHVWMQGRSRNVTMQTRHEVALEGLLPGASFIGWLHAADAAGNVGRRMVQIQALDDVQPPGAIQSAQAVSPANGVAVLTWGHATDDSGLRHYVLERQAADGHPAQAWTVPPDATSFRDPGAPFGQWATYTITPIDVAGHAGPATNLSVRVMAMPSLATAEILPARGPATDPFTVSVRYQHPLGSLPERIYLQHGSRTWDLVRADGMPCNEGCLFAAEIVLPATRLYQTIPPASITASSGGYIASATVDPMPLVFVSPQPAAADASASTDARAVPALGVGAVLVAGAALAAAGRRSTMSGGRR